MTYLLSEQKKKEIAVAVYASFIHSFVGFPLASERSAFGLHTMTFTSSMHPDTLYCFGLMIQAESYA